MTPFVALGGGPFRRAHPCAIPKVFDFTDEVVSVTSARLM